MIIKEKNSEILRAINNRAKLGSSLVPRLPRKMSLLPVVERQTLQAEDLIGRVLEFQHLNAQSRQVSHGTSAVPGEI